jgi:DnaJ-class molecular chaperone
MTQGQVTFERFLVEMGAPGAASIIDCPTCVGTGWNPDKTDPMEPCVDCAGTGRSKEPKTVNCGKCGGSGWLLSECIDNARVPCHVCENTGRVPYNPNKTEGETSNG